ncbi:MAG: GNAT family N-acetyltransferase [Planctomycetota bacterium]|jgi:mycothiol synthase
MSYPEEPQLVMLWPEDKLEDNIAPNLAVGYSTRTYRSGDEKPFLDLMAKVGFAAWDDQKLQFNLSRIIPDGWFFAVHKASGTVVGTAMCIHNYTQRHPFYGDLGWVACDPAHTGQGLGYSLSALVTARLLSAGYSRIKLGTEHYRLPAIKTYLRLGYVPVMYCAQVYRLWEEACQKLGWRYAPDEWPQNVPV